MVGPVSRTRWVAAAMATVGLGLSAALAVPGTALALGSVSNQAFLATTVHPGSTGVAAASYQIDTTNTFALGDTIYLKFEGVANPAVTNDAVGFAAPPSVAVTGPSLSTFGLGGAGNTLNDRTPTFTSVLASSAGAATVLGVKDEVVITLTNSSAGTATDHYTFTLSNVTINVGTAVGPGTITLHAYTGDGTGSLATAVTMATVTPIIVKRLAGSDRFATSVAISNSEFPNAGSAGSVVLARADDYPDALVGTALAANRNAPLLFAEGSTLPSATQAEIVRVLAPGRTVYILGGTSAIPASVAITLTGLGYVVVRYSGADRYGTALAVADALGDPATVLLATGTNFPDALAAGPAAVHVGGVVLLTAGTVLPPAVSAYLTAHANKVYAIGGPAVAADSAATALEGADRYATAAAAAQALFAAPTVVGIASGVAFPDALAGGTLLAYFAGPLLLSDSNVLSSASSNFLTTHKTPLTTVWLFGGTSALSGGVETEAGAAIGQ